MLHGFLLAPEYQFSEHSLQPLHYPMHCEMNPPLGLKLAIEIHHLLILLAG
jgi:hypothetical protein